MRESDAVSGALVESCHWAVIFDLGSQRVGGMSRTRIMEALSPAAFHHHYFC